MTEKDTHDETPDLRADRHYVNMSTDCPRCRATSFCYWHEKHGAVYTCPTHGDFYFPQPVHPPAEFL